MGDKSECGRRADAVLKRKSLRERQAKLTLGTSITLAEMVSASQPHAILLTASVSSHPKQTVIHQPPRQRWYARRHTEEELLVVGDPLSNARLTGDNLTLGSAPGRGRGGSPEWTQQRCLPKGGRATLGNDTDNLEFYKSCSAHLIGKDHDSGKLLLVESAAGGVTRKRNHSATAAVAAAAAAGGEQQAGNDAPPRPLRLSVCHESGQKAASAAACPTGDKAAACILPRPVTRPPSILTGVSWWPTLVLLLGLVLPTALGLPAVIRIGEYQQGTELVPPLLLAVRNTSVISSYSAAALCGLFSFSTKSQHSYLAGTTTSTDHCGTHTIPALSFSPPHLRPIPPSLPTRDGAPCQPSAIEAAPQQLVAASRTTPNIYDVDARGSVTHANPEH
ncbi:hypothetical protein E2C01_064546 [Portunus trituberculatus]|uniref:Uncharacterized protein n=1 Tax=Portunus trituberculatus TaxID=210409 RepID=A0A5B7HGF4_PORTR|nr:hypothetical protein [Portunus trituberculatus]